MKIKALLLIYLIFFSLFGFSQSFKKKTADNFYNELAYIEAVEYYKDLIKNKDVKEDDLRRLAFCYYNLSDYKNAELYYQKLNEIFFSSITQFDVLYLIETLKYNQKYQAAEKTLQQLQKKNENHLVVKNHLNNPNYIYDVKSDSNNYTITNVNGINTKNNEFSPVMDKTNRSMTFTSNRKNNSASNKTFAWDNTYFLDVYDAFKKDTLHFTDVTDLPKQMTSLYHDGPMVLSQNEKTMYLTRSNYVHKKVGKSMSRIVNLKLFILIKDSLTNRWNEPVSFDYNSDEYSVGQAAVSVDGKRLYFVSDAPGGFGLTDLYVSENKNGKWQKPENLGQTINTEGREMFPYIHEDGTLFFSSDGRAGLGGLDVYFSPINYDQYFEPQNLGYPLNTYMDDFGFYLNKDLLSGYFSSNRPGGVGKDDIYFFRSKKPILGSRLTGIVYDEHKQDPIPNAKVYLANKLNSILMDSAFVNLDGRYIFLIRNTKLSYKIMTQERKKYYDKSLDLKPFVNSNNTQDIYLDPKYKLICTVYDAETNNALEGVKATLIQKQTTEKKQYITSRAGQFGDFVKNKKMGDTVTFSVKFEKAKYINTIQDYEIVLDMNTILNINEKLNCRMQKMIIGNDIAKAIKINPIYFDLAKYNIRKDAAIELDKIVKVMQENPTMAIELGSHTDCRSSQTFNIKLSDKRAKASAAYIISKGIPKIRIFGKGYGETKLINKCECEAVKIVPCTEEEHQINRRTEFIIVKF